MAEGSASYADNLEAFVPRRFRDNLSEAEKRMLSAARQGKFARGGPNFDDKHPDNDPAKADDSWGSEREIRAELIRWLCVDQVASKLVDPRGIQVYAAKITDELDLSFVTVPFPLRLARCRLAAGGDLGDVRIPALSLDGSSTGLLELQGAVVAGSVFLSAGFSSSGEVKLVGARIGGSLECDGGTFKNADGMAINADRCNVSGYVFLREGFLAEGEVFLLNAQIGGNLECRRGTFKNAKGRAITADRCNVSGYVFLDKGFLAEGEVTLLNAQIGSNLECDEGTFKNPSGTALMAAGLKVSGFVFLRDGFSAEGDVDLMSAQIAGNLECGGGKFSALNLYKATVKGTLAWHDVKSATTHLDFRNASVGAIWDDKASWPDRGNLLLDGFVYESIASGPTGAEERLEWLDRQAYFTPQPYRQLAKMLRERGDDEGAKEVLFELESRARAENRRRLVHSPVRWLLRSTEDVVSDATVGYGMYPGRAIWYLGGLTALGWIVHRRAQRVGAMAPTDKDAYAEFRDNGHAPAHYPPFNPLVYSLENCVPLVKFGQDDHWQPDPNLQQRVNSSASVAGWQARIANLLFVRLPDRTTSPAALRWFRWIMIALGWLLATFFVASLTGIVKTG